MRAPRPHHARQIVRSSMLKAVFRMGSIPSGRTKHENRTRSHRSGGGRRSGAEEQGLRVSARLAPAMRDQHTTIRVCFPARFVEPSYERKRSGGLPSVCRKVMTRCAGISCKCASHKVSESGRIEILRIAIHAQRMKWPWI